MATKRGTINRLARVGGAETRTVPRAAPAPIAARSKENASSSILSLAGSFYMLVAAACWGGMFPVAKALLQFVDAFFLTLIRYALTFVVMMVILWAVEGKSSLRADGRGWSVFLYRCIGFCGFGFLVFTGLRASTPAHGAMLVALTPMITAVITSVVSPWKRYGNIALNWSLDAMRFAT
jgi:hypothetical protein